MKTLKTLVAFGLILSLVFSMTTAFAVERSSADLVEAKAVSSSGVRLVEETVVPCSMVVAANSGTISGYQGSVEVFLGMNVSYGLFQAGIAFSQTSGNVSCSVRYPSGSLHQLGVLPITTGAATPYAVDYYLKPGTYTFIFEASTPDAFEVLCTISEE